MLSLSGGQSLEDKLYAVKYFISGQALSLVVLKATTSELLGPKKKHLNYLVTITNEPNVSIPKLVKYLMQRARHPDWSVAFKSIITIHYLMSYGDEKFIQNLASSNVNHRSFDHLSSFVDRSSSQAYDMSTFLRRYTRYINIKTHTYRSLGTDFCKIKRTADSISNNQSPFRLKNMSIDQLMSTLLIIQNQFDILIAFDASAKDLSNGIINSAFSMLYKDFVKLYIVYQSAIIRLLELYFTVNQLKRAQQLLEGYKKFLIRMEKVCDFMRVIDSVGMDKSDMPNVSKSPSLSLKLLERHLDNLESRTNKRIYQQPVVGETSIKSVELPKLDYAIMLNGKRRDSLKGSSRGRLKQIANCSMKSPKLKSDMKGDAQIKNVHVSAFMDALDVMVEDKRDIRDCDIDERPSNNQALKTQTNTTSESNFLVGDHLILSDIEQIGINDNGKLHSAMVENFENQTFRHDDRETTTKIGKSNDWVKVEL